jgi:transcriptional regulator of heat shock response
VQKDFRKRQEEVLTIIVKHYVDTAEPVGSRFVSRKLGLSSATIRNVMADLEDMGFIVQPHTSAGRVPTDKGYRFYVDSLMRVRAIEAQVLRSIKDEYGRALRSLEDTLERTSHLISSLTNYVGVTLFSEYDKVYLDGTSHIIEEPEFQDFKKLQSLVRCLEEKREILDILHQDLEDDRIKVHIGQENKSGFLKDCSVVTRGYKIKGKSSGRIGVIGPKRMIYERVIPTIDFLADAVSELLEEVEQ